MQPKARISIVKTLVLDNKKIVQSFMMFGLLGLGGLLLAWQVHAADDNLYAKNYKQQNANQIKSIDAKPETKMYVSNHKSEDNISMLESGYDMMGFSSFSGTEVPVEMALQFGKEI